MDVVTAGPPEWRWATAPATSSTIFMITPPCTAPRRLASNVVMIRDSVVCAAEDGRPGSSVSCTRYDGTGSGRKTCARHFRDRGELLVANGGLSQGDDLRHQAPRRVGRTTVQKRPSVIIVTRRSARLGTPGHGRAGTVPTSPMGELACR